MSFPASRAAGLLLEKLIGDTRWRLVGTLLALSLLVLRIFAQTIEATFSPYQFTVITKFFNRSSNLHISSEGCSALLRPFRRSQSSLPPTSVYCLALQLVVMLVIICGRYVLLCHPDLVLPIPYLRP